jgi:hypothetical protein
VIAPASGRWSPRAKAVPVAAIDKADLTIGGGCSALCAQPRGIDGLAPRARRARHVGGLSSTRIQYYPRRLDGAVG